MRRVVILCAVAAALFAVLPFAGASARAKSSSFAGYMAVAPSGQFLEFKYVTATFTVPSLNCSATPDYSAVYQWAALGGYHDNNFNASGVYEYCSGGASFYEGVVAQNGGTIQNNNTQVVLAVNPGDEVSASVHWTPGSGDFTWTLVDRSTGKYFQQTLLNYQYPALTAEVISNGNVNSDGTADFGSVNFFNIKVTDTNMPGSRGMIYSAWNTLKFREWGIVTGGTDVQPGAITTTTAKPFESAFTNTWLATDRRS